MPAPKPLLPVPGMTPEVAANPYAGAAVAESPYAAQALTTNILPPFSATPEGRGEAPPPQAEPEPVDPYAGATAVTPTDAYAGAVPAPETRGYDLTKVKAAKVADLVKDKTEFNPVEFYAQNEKALLADPFALKQVEDAYAEREKEKMTVGQLAKKVLAAPFTVPQSIIAHPIESAKTAVKVAKSGAEFLGELGKGVGEVFRTGGKAAGHLSTGDLPGTAGRISEAADAFDSAQQRWVTTITTKLLPRPTDIRERLAYDADFKKREMAAAAGNGELARALGTDVAGLKDSGVTIDPEAVKRLSVIEDPMFLVPIGGSIGVVSRGGKFLLGRAVSPAAAEAVAKLGNALMEKSAAGVAGATELAGKGVEKAGAGVETAGKVLSTGLGRAGVVGGAVFHALSSGNFVPLLKAAVAPSLVKGTGKVIQAVGRGVQAAAPAVGTLATEAAKGSAEAGALALPLFIGSTPEERDSLLGMVAAGGALRAGGAGLGMAAEAGGRGAQNALAKKIFEPVDAAPIKDSPYYGTDPKLDAAHAEHAQNLSPREQAVLNQTRELFRDSGVEVYSLDNKTFTNHVPSVGGAESAEGWFTTRGERVNQDGTRQPVIQILLNGDTNGLGHELYHAFKSLDPAGASALESHIKTTWTPEEQQWIADQYNAALNGGKPRSEWTVELGKDQILEEAASEVFGRVFQGADLTGVAPSVQKRAATFASGILEKLGFPLAGKGVAPGAGVSALGVRPSTAEAKISGDFLADLTKRAKAGKIFQSKPIKPAIAGELVPGDISRARVSATPSAAPELAKVTPTPKPATAPKPLAETPAPTIKSPEIDISAERAKVTNADAALSAAKEISPEAVKNVESINTALTEGHGVEIIHKGVIKESPGAKAGRGTRRAEQAEAYVKEAMGEVPENIREQHQKVLFPTRWQSTAKSGQQLTARSLDKAIANVKNAVEMAAKVKEPIPYETTPDGKLTPAGWSEAVQDLRDYWGNQDRGFRGDGEKLVRPTGDIGVSLPVEDPRGPVATISPDRTDFLNLVQGLNIPEAVTRQLSGKVPGNVKGQLLAEAQGRKPQKPAGIKPEDIKRQAYKPIEGVPGLREIAEVNPLRNRLRAAGAPVDKLIEVTENVNLKNIESATPRPDVTGRGGSTDITRAGFSVKAEPSAEVRDVAEKAAKASGVAEYKPSTSYAPVNEALAKKLADAYDAAKSNPADPAVKASYDALIDQTEKQGKAILDAGYTVEPFPGEGEPYKSSAEMVADVRDNKHLFFLETEPGASFAGAAENPMLRPSKIVEGQVANDVFRWVHDFFGHAKEGYQFGPRGEFNAWKSHSEMFTPEAQGALAAETLAQNSWVNYGKHLRDEAGNVVRKGDPGYVDIVNRPFAEQKNIVIPDDLIQQARGAAGTTGKFSVADRGDEILKQTPEEWVKTAQAYPGGLTSEAYRLGLGLTDRADLARLAEFRKLSEEKFRETMKSGDFEAAGPEASKAQFFREAWEAAQGIGSAASGIKNFDPNAKPPFPVEEGSASFSPTTRAGKELAKDGYDFIVKGELGNRTVFVSKDGVEVGYATSKQFDPKTAELAMTHLQKDLRGKGAGEALYRELFNQLKKDGVELVEGMVVAPEPLALRNKIFGGEFEKLEMGGEPTTLDEALVGANLVKKGVPTEFPGVDVVNRIKPDQSFSVRKKRETESEAQKRIAETDYSKYNVPEAAKEMKTSGTGWFFPDKEFVPLDQAYHEQFLAENSEQLNKRFGTKFTPDADVEQRLDALNKGFIRSRFQPANGRWHIEANVNHWDAKSKQSVYDLLEKHEGSLDNLNVNLVDNKGDVVDRISEKLHDLQGPEKLSAVKDALDGLKTGGEVAEKKGPSNISRVRSFSVKPKEESLPGFEDTSVAQTFVRKKVAASRKFPEAKPLEYRKEEDGSYKLVNGKPVPIAEDYAFLDTPLAKETGKGIKDPVKKEELFTDKLSDRIVTEYEAAKKNPEISAGEKWYSTCRVRLRKLLGEDTKLFAELLGATSGRTAVGTNFGFALEAYNQYKSGAYDSQISKYREGKQNFDAGNTAEFTADTGKEAPPTRAAYLDWWIEKHNLTPTAASGKRFGMNSRQVLKVLDGSWAAEIGGPKTPNFTGNLTGSTFEATIDVWAARMLHRLSNEDNKGKWRIQPGNEKTVTDNDFFTGQKAFRKAADKIGIKPDSLQAILWFAEKNHWEQNGWTDGVGAAKSDFNTLLAETQRQGNRLVMRKKNIAPELTLEDIKAK